MKVIGIQNGALLQRGKDNTCSVYLESDSELKTSFGLITEEDGLWHLTGIPVGGPYSFSVYDASEEIHFEDIYVGDLWLLAGQSNMEGAGRMRPEDYEIAENPEIRALYFNDEWKCAKPQLHQYWISNDPAHQKLFESEKENRAKSSIIVKDFPPAESMRGVGPGYFFAKKLYEKTGVPQGVIPAAVGGASIEMWIPDENDNYYSSTIRRLKLSGRSIRGMFWYQGEGYGGSKEKLKKYTEMFSSMRNGFSECCRLAELPTVSVQVFRCTIPWAIESKENAFIWSDFRQHQLNMGKELDNLVVVANNDLELDDCIHLSASSQERLGYRSADTMLYLTEKTGIGEPEIESISVSTDEIVSGNNIIAVKYKNIRGKLISAGYPSGFSLSEGDEMPSETWMQHISLKDDTVYIRMEMDRETLKKKSLWYAFGHTFRCNITDEADHAIPAFGPIGLYSYI